MTERYMNRAEFARFLGLSKPGILKAVNTGKIDFYDGFVDVEGINTVDYIDKHRALKSKPRNKPRPRTKKSKPKTEVIKADDMEIVKREETVEASIETMSQGGLAKQKIRGQILTQQVKLEQLRGDLISRDVVRRHQANLFSIDTSELHPLGEKISAEVYALSIEKVFSVVSNILGDKHSAAVYSALVEDDAKIQIQIKGIIDKHVFRRLAHAKRRMNDFLEKIGAEKV
jgi:hypothetical protein